PDQGEFWWERRPCDYYPLMDGNKIIYPDIAKSPRFHLDEAGTWIRNTAYCLDAQDMYLLGVLNSAMMWFCIARLSIPFGERAGEYRYRMFTQYIEKLPIPRALTGTPQPKAIASLADSMIALHRREQAAKLPQEKEQLRRQI